MATFCIDRAVAQKMKEGVKNGDINVADLYAMTSDQRRGVFTKYSSPDLAKFINANFERAMVSKQKDALKSWAQKTFDAKKQTLAYKGVIEKIEDLDKLGVLNPQTADLYLQDLVSDQLGVNIQPDEVKEILKGAQELEKLSQNIDDVGNPGIEYWVAREKFEKYLQGLTPTAPLRVATSTAGRGAMLLSLKSPLTNIVGNTVQGLTQAFERRLSSNSYKGLNNEFAKAYVKKVNKIYQKSGFDISRMLTMGSDQVRLGEEITHSEGPGAVRQVGRFYEDVVFKQLMGAPDVMSASIAFADSANLASTKIADSEGLKGKAAKQRALEIFKDSTRIEPQTEEGELVRAQATADATYATYTNDGFYAGLAMGIRNVLNKALGDVRLGDQLMPFVKTPANVIQFSVEATPVGLITAAYRTKEALRLATEGDPRALRDVVRLAIRSGLGTTLATMLAYAIDPEDFVGEYEGLDPKGRTLARIKGAGYNSLKIGDKYISLDYFGPLAAHMVGLLYARKYGDTLPEKIALYTKGVSLQAARVPGFRQIGDLVDDINRTIQQGKLGQLGEGLTETAVSYIRSRTIPAIVNDFAKGLDPLERVAENPVEKVLSSIPGARQSLEPRVSQVSGEKERGEGLIGSLLFGARLQTANESRLVAELDRLYKEDAAPTVSDITRSSKRMKELKEQLTPGKFTKAIEYFGQNYGKEGTSLITQARYQRANDEAKRDLLNKVRSETLNKTLVRFGYKKKSGKSQRSVLE